MNKKDMIWKGRRRSDPSRPRPLADAVLRMIWQERRISRADIARQAELSRSTVTEIVAEILPTGLVAEIEAGRIDGQASELILRQALAPMLAAGVDTFVLGCTHYPFALPLIRRLVGPQATILDPAPAVARQVERVLEQRGLIAVRTRPGKLTLFTSADPQRFARVSGRLMGETFSAHALTWQDSSRLTAI